MRYLVILIFIGFIASCDIIQEPYIEKKDNNPVDTTDTTVYIRKVLLEDYTGHRCGNCPRSHEKMQELLNTYGDKIVPISVHVGFFAMPIGQYTAEYRTSTGNELNTYFGNDNAGLPNGMVNRINWQGDVVLNYSSWQQVIESIITNEPDLGIDIKNTYNQGTKVLDTKIDIKGLKDITGNFKLAVYIVQDSIVSMQTDYNASPQDIPNYVHRHVLRGAINSTWGDVIALQTISKGEEISRTFNYTINSAWNSEKCYVLAYVYNDENKEVIQAEEEKIIK